MLNQSSICFATATCRNDIHYARCLLGSIRWYYPDNPIIVVCDQDVDAAERRQLASFPNTTVYSTAELTDTYKLRFRGTLTDLYYLVMQDHQHYLFCDADSVLTGPVLDRVSGDPAFVAFTGKQMDLGIPESRTSFCRYAIDLDAPGDLDLSFLSDTPFYFQSSHFLLDRFRFPVDELYRHLHRLDFGIGHTIETPFQRGDQGFLCYVLNRHFVETEQFLHVACTPSADSEVVNSRNLTARAIREGTAACGFLHFVGPTRRWTLGDHAGGDVLKLFYDQFWQVSSGGSVVPDSVRLLRTSGPALRRYLRRFAA